MALKKKIVSIFLIIGLIFAIMPALAFAEDGEDKAGSTEYGLRNPRISEFTNGNGKVDLDATWDCIWFGSYQQSGLQFGESITPIKWRVLSVDGNDAFLLADECLDSKPYNSKLDYELTWEKCSLRSWLNETFYDNAFTEEEKDAIITTTVINKDNPKYEIEGGNDTVDNVYLLSIDEVLNTDYGFPSADSLYSKTRSAEYTSYAVEDCGGHNGNGYWLLRSPGGTKGGVAYVHNGGTVDEYGGSVTSNHYGIRPALHIDLSSSVWSPAGTVTTIDTHWIHDSFTSTIDDEEREFSGNKGFYYSDSYFHKDATKYNHSLATMSLCMAYSAYGFKEKNSDDYSSYDKNIKELMTKCGFASEGRYKEYHFNEKPTKDSIGCAIGYKRITIEDKTYPVIAVAVRGGGYEAEWANNFNVGSSGDHRGFDKSADSVKDYIIDYIMNQGVEGNIKIWITGFSRGGAVATQTAAKLNDMAGFSYQDNESGSEEQIVIFDKTSVYAYGFATPAGVVASSNPHSSAYSNIFNIIEYNDPVPLVAPSDWGCDRYGKTKLFIYKEGNQYSQYIEKVAERINKGRGYNVAYFKNYIPAVLPPAGPDPIAIPASITAFENPLNKDSQGTTLRKSVRALADIIGSRESYTSKYEERFTKGIAEAHGLNINVLFTDALTVILEKVPEMGILHPNLTTTLIMNRDTLFEPHADQEYYLAWMQLMDDNYAENMDHLPLAWGNPNYRVFRANCPVDIYVYDGDKIVASIFDDKPSNYGEIVASIDENGQKILYLPADGNYKVDVEAREACEVSCGVEEYDAEFGEPTRITNFETTSLESNETITATIDAFTDEELAAGASDGSDTSYVMTKDGENIEIISDLHGEEEITEHTYDVSTICDDSQGAVYGGGTFAEGSYARLEAVANENYTFDGFYINGEKYEDSSSSEGANAVRLKVTKDIEVEAKFSFDTNPPTPPTPPTPDDEHTHTYGGWLPLKPATEMESGTLLRICSECGHIEIKDSPKLSPSLKAVKLLKPKAAKKSATIKWKKISKKNLKKIRKVQIQYSTDKNFRSNVKSKYAKASKTSYKIKGLKKGKTYYVRIRAYTSSGGQVHVSKWTSAKKVKAK